MYNWSNGKKFAFTIIDDTDGATPENIKPVYDYLYQRGIITTKTVWIYPPRDYFTGDSIQNEKYMEYVQGLMKQGYEIAFHDAGSGVFSRSEITASLEKFREAFGEYPKMHINHGDNPSGIYWGDARFSAPVNFLFKAFKKLNGGYVRSAGSLEGSGCFWGDECKKRIKYIRNRVFSELNILKRDKHMPYREKSKDKYSNYWFSSSDGINAETFCALLSEKNVERLVREGGCAFVYVHFGYGFTDKNTGLLREDVKQAIDRVAKYDGWFAPTSEILDYMLSCKNGSEYLSAIGALKMDIVWLYERIKRKISYRV